MASTQTFHELNAASTPVSAATLYNYDAFGEPVLSGLDLNGNGVLDLATDRVSGQTNTVVQIGADYWRESTSWTYPNENSLVPVTTGTSRSRLTGLGAAAPAPYSGVLTSESVSIDLSGNQTRQITYTDAANQTTWSVTDTPDSNLDAVAKSVGGVTVESTSPVGEVTTYAYDDLRRPILTSVLRPLTSALTSTNHYNALGQVDYVEDGATNRTTFVYDNLGRRVETIDALNQSTHTAYDPEGRVLATWGATYPVAYEYDDQGRMTALYTYRGTNEITSVADILALKPAMDKTTWIYDPATGLITQKLDADNKGATYTYTPAGQLATRTWARGVTTTYDYDPATGSLTDVDYSDATPDVANTYDRMGRPLSTVSRPPSPAPPLQTITYAYNPTTLALTTETWQGLVTDTLTRSTDPLGRNSGFQTLGGMNLDYAYDAAGRFAAITSVVATVTNVATYAYVPNSRLLTGYTMGGFTRTVDYETDRNLIASVVNTFGTNLVSRFDYTNDPLGRRTQRLDTWTAGFQSATNSFTYNVRSELASALFPSPLGTPISRSATYQYDPIGNRIQAVENSVQTDYVSNMLNQYTAINAATPSYDDDGNMLTTGSGWVLTWDGENRLLTASNATTVITNTYDPRSRRIRKQVADAGTPVSDLRYFYDGWSLLHEHDVLTGSPVTHYLWGLDLSGTLQGAGGVGGLLAEVRSGQSAVAAADANGNITEYVNGSTGALSARYAYDGFGKTIATSGPSSASFTHRFSSKYQDSEIGWYYYGYRYYDPEIGRWPSRDPMGERGGTNLHGFVANAPTLRVDPLGLVSVPQIHLETFKEAMAFSPGAEQTFKTNSLMFGINWYHMLRYSKTFATGCRIWPDGRLTCGYVYGWRFKCSDCCDSIIQKVTVKRKYFKANANDAGGFWITLPDQPDYTLVEGFGLNNGQSGVDQHFSLTHLPKTQADGGSITAVTVTKELVSCCGKYDGQKLANDENAYKDWGKSADPSKIQCSGPTRTVAITFTANSAGNWTFSHKSVYAIIRLHGGPQTLNNDDHVGYPGAF